MTTTPPPSETFPPAQAAPPGVAGDLVIDAAVATLLAAPAEDLDATLAAGEELHRTLTARLADLGE
ncbi:MAG: hypothetical protein IPH03_07740 [Tetrasphaera sp.]|mgnify:CR=1 FL=1|jgi:hypothetical protein|nr:hypothetical protein [Tetrasphaera sp.]